jgi:sterol desaturase/sphingolipid hydroxylase (fatty acid hydroxylase superfamily)
VPATWTDLALDAGLTLAFLLVVFRPLELAFPARAGQRFLRPGWATDLAYFAGQALLFGGVLVALLYPAGTWLGRHMPGALRVAVASQPWWLQALEVVVLSDLVVYWAHRLQHRVGFLWRFHKVHHSTEHLDWLAAHREHPLDSVYTLAAINLPAFALGFPLATLGGLFAFRGLWAVYIHSNVSARPGWLGVVLGDPQLHRVHHAAARYPGNYANISPLMDVLFGTYRRPARAPERLGLGEPYPRSYLGQMLAPFVPARRRAPRAVPLPPAPPCVTEPARVPVAPVS